jgi:hypothetical protein
MKLIVTHISPDLDAATSSWLIKKYLPGWDEAEHAFVPAGATYENLKPDENPEVIHVDTGLGQFDHHQSSERSSATEKVFKFLALNKHIKEKDFSAIEEMTKVVTQIDNFQEVHFPDPTNSRYAFSLHEFMYPLRGQLTSDHELISMTSLILESIFLTIKNSLKAEGEIKEGFVFSSGLGKVLIMETKNEVAVKHALKKGFEVVIRIDPEVKTIRIKTQPDPKYDLTKLYEKITKSDKKATWFLHASKNMLLNGSSKNPNSVPSSLSAKELIAIVENI